ncbi:TPA: hypothetical protein ACTPQ2_004592 [Salmonella enterica]
MKTLFGLGPGTADSDKTGFYRCPPLASEPREAAEGAKKIWAACRLQPLLLGKIIFHDGLAFLFDESKSGHFSLDWYCFQGEGQSNNTLNNSKHCVRWKTSP